MITITRTRCGAGAAGAGDADARADALRCCCAVITRTGCGDDSAGRVLRGAAGDNTAPLVLMVLLVLVLLVLRAPLVTRYKADGLRCCCWRVLLVLVLLRARAGVAGSRGLVILLQYYFHTTFWLAL